VTAVEVPTITASYCDVVLGERHGFLAVAFGQDGYWDAGKYKHPTGKWTERRYRWPGARGALDTDITRMALAGDRVDVYVCPLLRSTNDRRKGSALRSQTCWADQDGPAADPELVATLEPFTVDSGSDGHRHLYVLLTREVDPGIHARLNKALALRLGADHKWSDESLLRLPGTLNHKADPPTAVTVLPWSGRRWDPDELAVLLGVDLSAAAGAPTSPNGHVLITPEAAPDPLPARVRRALKDPDPADRSAAHHRLVRACKDAGLTAGQTLTVATGYGPSRAKFNGRLAGEVARSWAKARPPDTTSATHDANTDRQRGEGTQGPLQPLDVGSGHCLDTVTELSTGEPMADETSLADLYQPIDWHELWDTTTAGPDWLVPDVIERGRVHVIYAPKKQEKSLLTLMMVASLATGQALLGRPNHHGRALRVLYIDLENPESDIRERLEDAGYRPDDLPDLRYLSFPSLPGLDSPTGGAHLLALVERHQPELIVLDSTARVVAGKENDADTSRNFYRHSMLPVKALGLTVLRLDNTGKDVTLGQRGSSAKGDEPDTAWCQTRRASGRITLRLDFQRTNHHPQEIELVKHVNPLRYVRIDTAADRPEVVKLLADLDGLGVPAVAGREVARAALTAAGIKISNADLAEAVRRRKSCPQDQRTAPLEDDLPEIDNSCPEGNTTIDISADESCPGQSTDSSDSQWAPNTGGAVREIPCLS
jgi:hypothetical protein